MRSHRPAGACVGAVLERSRRRELDDGVLVLEAAAVDVAEIDRRQAEAGLSVVLPRGYERRRLRDRARGEVEVAGLEARLLELRVPHAGRQHARRERLVDEMILRRRGVELPRRDDLPLLRGARPDQGDLRLGDHLEVLEAEGDPPAGLERDRPGPLPDAAHGPVVDDEPSVHPEAGAVVGLHVERVRLGVERFELPAPAHGEILRVDRRVRRAQPPIEVDDRVDARQLEVREILVVEVLAAQAAAAPEIRRRGWRQQDLDLELLAGLRGRKLAREDFDRFGASDQADPAVGDFEEATVKPRTVRALDLEVGQAREQQPRAVAQLQGGPPVVAGLHDAAFVAGRGVAIVDLDGPADVEDRRAGGALSGEEDHEEHGRGGQGFADGVGEQRLVARELHQPSGEGRLALEASGERRFLVG